MKSISIFGAFIVGVVQQFFLSMSWTILGTWPLRAILSLGPSPGAFRVVTTVSDVIINLVLSLPAAYVLCSLRPKNLLPLYLALAVIPVFVWNYRLVFTDPDSFADWAAFLPGIVISLVVLPIAALLMRKLVLSR